MNQPQSLSRRIRPVPEEIRCRWKGRDGERGVYDCPVCGCWTANLPLYKDTVCHIKERRNGEPDRRQRR